MSQTPELIAKLRVGSIVSGECSVCHEVIIVQDPGAGMPNQLGNTLRQAFEEHVHQESPLRFVASSARLRNHSAIV